MRAVGYTGGIRADVLYARLTDVAPGLEGAEGEARGAITLASVDTDEMINGRIAQLEERIGKVFATHPDRVIFASLPQSGTVRAADLLAKIGDCRQKFPTDVALAGAGWRVTLDPAVRQTQTGRVPLGMQQEAALRRHGLRQRQPRRRPMSTLVFA